MASDKDIRRMYDEDFRPFFDEVLPEIMTRLERIEKNFDHMWEPQVEVDSSPDERPVVGSGGTMKPDYVGDIEPSKDSEPED